MQGFRPGKKENKLGIRASDTSEVIMENCFVGDDRLLGQAGEGFVQALEILDGGRISIAALGLGTAIGAFEAAVRYAKEREQFGKAIAEFQGVQFQLAQMVTDLEAARMLVYNTARLKDAGQPFAPQAAMAKLFSSQVAGRITSQCVELFGGFGYTRDYPAEKFYRDAKIGAIYEGTSNMQLQTIAKNLLTPR
jgi:alkylation response protein AidB-like acyl-CoA dehydrogenase